MAMLHACSQLAQSLKLRLEVAHIDHGLRKESAGDARFVHQLASGYGLRFHLKRAARKPVGQNLEDWGRKLRYAFFSSLLKKRRLDCVLTAHTASDQLETFLMRLIQNREFEGIACCDRQRRLARPLLGIERSQIDAYIRQNRLKFVEDSSNRDTAFLRNRIRRKLIPYLKRNFGPEALQSLSSRAESIAIDSLYIRRESTRLAARLQNHPFGSKTWLHGLRRLLRTLHPAVSFRLLSSLFYEQAGRTLGRKAALRLSLFITGTSPGLELPGGIALQKHKGGLILRRARK